MSGKAEVKVTEKTLSRVGRKPIPIPQGVQVDLGYVQISVKGPKGALVLVLHPETRVALEDGTVVVERFSARKLHRSLHGLTRSLIANAITGVTQGYHRTLELMGVGYRAHQAGDGVVLSVGYSHQVEVKSLEGVTLTVEGNNRIHVEGCDKQKVGEVAARIRKVRPPNPYKEKGIKYSDEVIHLKPGKAATRKA